MSFNHFNRRLHLYLGLCLLPWFFIYGLSSLPFSHPKWFDRIFSSDRPMWTTRFDRSYSIDAPASGDLKAAGAKIAADAGLSGSVGAYRQNDRQIGVYVHTFWKATRLTYFTDQKRLLAEDRRFRWDHFLTGLHARGGFEQEGLLVNAWSWLVDLVQLGILVWIVSGIYMWWKLPRLRGWGWLAITAGAASFAALVW